jgi:YtkA-like
VRRSPLFLALALLMAVPAVAGAGGFATAGLSSTPDGVAAGKPWKVDITVLQHGRTPVEGVVPRVQISSGDTMREFAAKPTGEPGVYRAEVVFPTAGRWDYVVLDGFNDQMPHTFPAVRIGDGAAAPAAPSPAQPPAPAPAPAPPADNGIAAGWLWGAGLVLLLALVVLLADRERRRPGAAPRGVEPA